MHNTIIENRKAKIVAICRLAVTSKTDDTCHRARLGLHIAMSKTGAHSPLQSTIHTSNWQGLFEMRQDVLVLVSIAKELDLQFGRNIVVERKTGAIRKLISGRIKSNLSNQLALNISGTLGTCRTVASRRCNLIIHAFGIEIITVFHHLMQNLVHGMETGTDGESTCRTALHGSSGTGIEDTSVLQLGEKSFHENILASENQWG